MRSALLLLAAISFQSTSALDTILARLDRYLAEYEPRLSQVIADEDMTQTRPARSRAGTPFRHQLKSEVVFVRLPGDGAWLGYHNVKSVNGRPVNQAALGFLVPLRMHEIFAIDNDRGRSEARYSNFRAFGTSARIVPQP